MSDDLASALNQFQETSDAAAASLGTEELINHIQTRFHEAHRRELPELVRLAKKVEIAHAKHPRVPCGLADLLYKVLGELEVHMKKEELILFPAMRGRQRGGLDVPIAQMRYDHDDHDLHMREIERLTGGLSLPAEACNSWTALYRGLEKFADDLVEHIHLENNVLFPRYEGAGTV